MKKEVVLQSRARPDVPGYPDTIIVLIDDGIRFACYASASPNPRKPFVKGGTPWDKAYGWLAPGEYHWRCVMHWRYGKCLLINEGGDCASRVPNPNHGGAFILRQVFVHSGQSAAWRGSAGCPTVPPIAWPAFVAMFDAGDKGVLSVLDYIESGIN